MNLNNDSDAAAAATDGVMSASDGSDSNNAASPPPRGNSSPEDVQMENVESDRGISDVAMMSPAAQQTADDNAASAAGHAAGQDGNDVEWLLSPFCRNLFSYLSFEMNSLLFPVLNC